jgi:hypothetical protein
MSPINAQLDALIAAVCDNRASDEQLRQLTELLRDDPGAQDRYLELMDLHALLGSEKMLAGVDAQAAPRTPWAVRLFGREIRPARLGLFAMAATLLIYAVFFKWVLQPGDVKPALVQKPVAPTALPVARVTALYQPVWREGATEWSREVALSAGLGVQLESGLVELTFADGAQVVIAGPCDFVVNGRGSGTLERGKLTAQVAAHAAGFTIHSGDFQIVDLGTRFTVEAKETGELDVAVEVGRVEVRQGTRVEVELSQGQAWRYEPAVGDARIAASEVSPVVLPKTPWDGMQYVHWSFDEPAHGKLFDRGAGISSGPFHIPYDASSDAAPQSVPGKFGRALSFDGVDDRLTTPFPGIRGDRPRTVACWMRVPAQAAAKNCYLVGWGAPLLGKKWHLCLNQKAKEGPVGALRCEVGFGWIVGGPDLRDGQWRHVAAVLPESPQPNISQARLYLDGRLVSTEDVAPAPIDTGDPSRSNRPVLIGVSVQGDSYLRGEVDDVYVFAEALTAEQIGQLMRGANQTQ